MEKSRTSGRRPSTRTRGPASTDRAFDATRNEKAVNPLKSHNSAKWPDFAYNDFNDLRPPLRNVSFRLAKYAFRLAGFLTNWGGRMFRLAPPTSSRGVGRPRKTADRISYRRPQGELRFFSGPSPQRSRAPERSPDLSKLGRWRLCGDDQGVKKLRNSQPPRASRRREAASKDASGAANEAMSSTILRDAKLRFAPQDEAGGWRSRC